MRKIILKILLILLVLLVLYTVFNQFDVGEPTPGFSLKDIPPATFDRNNGFYRLFSLVYPENVDIELDEVFDRVRQLFDPQFDNDKYLEEQDPSMYKKMYSPFYKKYRQLGRLELPTMSVEADWTRYVLSIKERIKKVRSDLTVFLARYQKLIDCKVFEDFTLIRAESPVPNLLAWLHAARLYTAVNLLDAAEGNWEQGASNLLDHLDFGKRTVKGIRVMITNLIGKAVTRLSIRAIASLMNQKECPKEVFQLVLDRTPPLKYEEFGSGTSFIGEALVIMSFYKFEMKDKSLLERLLYSLFFQENRVKKVHYVYMSKLLKYEKTPPYQWESDLEPPKKFASGWFWWLQNPMGKIFLDNIGHHSFKNIILKSYISKTYYDMLRISAELHLNYTPDKPVLEILNGLETYKEIDPCSGKPYIWNEEKQILYSIGIDRKDDNGTEQRYTFDGDYVIPVILYLR